jgi:hypothetical protein
VSVGSSVFLVVRSVCHVECFVRLLYSFHMRSHFFVYVCKKVAIPHKYLVTSSWDRVEVVLMVLVLCVFVCKFI